MIDTVAEAAGTEAIACCLACKSLARSVLGGRLLRCANGHQFLSAPVTWKQRLQRQVQPPRAYVDFNIIPESQIVMDRRLLNWARWSRGSPKREGVASPMFTLHRSDSWETREYGAPTLVPIDHQDATRIAAAVGSLPDGQRKAIHWAYLRPYHPAAKARELGVDLPGLQELVRAGRQALVDQGV